MSTDSSVCESINIHIIIREITLRNNCADVRQQDNRAGRTGMWTPDIRTVFLTICLINAFLTLMILVYWRTQKTYEGFALWSLGLLFQSVAFLLFMMQGAGPVFFTILLANALSMLAILLRIDAIRRFFWSRPMPAQSYLVIIPVFFIYAYFTYIAESILLRTAISTLFIAPALIIAASLAVTSRQRENRIIRYLFAAALTVPALILAARTVAWLLIPGQYTIFSPDAFNTGFFIVAVIADILATGFFLMLNMIRSRTELEESEVKYHSLFENMVESAAYCRLIYDDTGKPADWHYLDVNVSFRQIYGIQDIIGKRCGEVFPGILQEHPELLGSFSRVVATGQPERFEVQLREVGRWFSCSVFSPKHDHFVTIFDDVTQRKQAESALLRINAKLNLLSSITRHDIRNQLHALSGYLELSRLNSANPQRLLESVGKAEGVAETINRQLEFTKDYEEMGVTAPSWQNVDAIVSHAVASLPIKGTRIEVERPDLEVYADPLLGKVFYNLIDNALRHGGDRLTRIWISARETSAGLVLTCENNGNGIPFEEKRRLFERGYGKHTGLGLFLSSEILSITDITITENGDPETGVRFEMVVPKGEFRFI
jgi:signal transduction histidine kinase